MSEGIPTATSPTASQPAAAPRERTILNPTPTAQASAAEIRKARLTSTSHTYVDTMPGLVRSDSPIPSTSARVNNANIRLVAAITKAETEATARSDRPERVRLVPGARVEGDCGDAEADHGATGQQRDQAQDRQPVDDEPARIRAVRR